jgi:hypothetical protein
MLIPGITATSAYIRDLVTVDHHAASAQPLASVIWPSSHCSDRKPTWYFYPLVMLLDVVVISLHPLVFYSHSFVQGSFLLFFPIPFTVSSCNLDSFLIVYPSHVCHPCQRFFDSCLPKCQSIVHIRIVHFGRLFLSQNLNLFPPPPC